MQLRERMEQGFSETDDSCSKPRSPGSELPGLGCPSTEVDGGLVSRVASRQSHPFRLLQQASDESGGVHAGATRGFHKKAFLSKGVPPWTWHDLWPRENPVVGHEREDWRCMKLRS